MAKQHSTFRLVLTLVLLAGTAAICVALGNWQLRRAAERETAAKVIKAGRMAAPIQLTTATDQSELTPWRRATAHGTWLNDFTVLLDNRNFKGKAGYWVATPLLIDPSTHTALLVLRGWLPRPLMPGTTLPPLAGPEGEQTIQGQITSRVPRLFELWSFSKTSVDALPPHLPSPDKQPPKVQNLALKDLSRTTGLKLLPVVLEQTATVDPATPGARPFVQEWPLPVTNSERNHGYALQWFSFAGIAGIAALILLWRALRRRTKTTPEKSQLASHS